MPFTGYRVTSPFGWRKSPFGGAQEFHTGIDVVKTHKAPINAFTEGSVLYAGFGNAGTGLGGYGNVVVVKDKNGRAQVYAHLDSVAVKSGARISKGQVVGYQGTTGQSTGSHLHFEVRKTCAPSYGWEANRAGNCLDPTVYLKAYSPPSVSKPVTGGGSIVDYLNAKGISSTFTNRAKLAAQHGIKNYSGTASQNITLLAKVKGGATSVQPKGMVHLPASAKTWRTYKLSVQPVTKNSDWSLTPSAFGGLTYEIIGKPYADVVTINTSRGKRNIYVGKGTGAIIK
ncbi:peptidoglycan DD-metalloendopeptidase family protein [Bacillus sp. FSL K6-3431]|uniref:peptidoglycan DD-metalloendopeptidase family protein n=1 Tax=Bacillus sp. FSL K6-3431 TaxID=2921500 RepID=UPI0030F5BEC5